MEASDVKQDEDTPVRAVHSPGADFSLVDVFKQELQELTDTKEVYIPVKGYGQTGLQIKYHFPENGKLLDRIGRATQREFKDGYSRNIYAAIDTMIELCDGIYVQPPGVDEPVMLDPDETGEACGFDNTLATLMGIGDDVNMTARQVVKKLFGNNELAVLDHAERLNRWLQNTKADVNAEVWEQGE